MDAVVMAVSRSAKHTLAKPNQDSVWLAAGLGCRRRRAPGGHRQAPLAGRARPDPAQSAPGSPDPRRTARRIASGWFHNLARANGREHHDARCRSPRFAGRCAAASRWGYCRSEGTAQSVCPVGPHSGRSDGRHTRPGRARQPRPQGWHHGHRDRRGRSTARRSDPGRAAAAAASPARAGLRRPALLVARLPGRRWL